MYSVYTLYISRNKFHTLFSLCIYLGNGMGDDNLGDSNVGTIEKFDSFVLRIVKELRLPRGFL
jgi:hypothetical protein